MLNISHQWFVSNCSKNQKIKQCFDKTYYYYFKKCFQKIFSKPTRVSLPAYSPRSRSRHVDRIGVYMQTPASVDQRSRCNTSCCCSPQQRSCRRPGRPALWPTVPSHLPPSSRASTSSPALAWRGLVWPKLKPGRWHEAGDPGLPLQWIRWRGLRYIQLCILDFNRVLC